MTGFQPLFNPRPLADLGQCCIMVAGGWLNMLFDKLVEEKIREAIANGEFDDLPGKGKPISLDEYFSTPEDIRMTNSVLKNAGVAPEEVGLLREVESLKVRLAESKDEEHRAELCGKISEGLLKYNLLMERRKRSLRSTKT
jgi:hypothetical protein